MKYILVIVAVLAINLTFGQSNSGKDTSTTNPNYNKELADKLGGDDYGMKSYFLVILKTGTNTTTDKEFISHCCPVKNRTKSAGSEGWGLFPLPQSFERLAGWAFSRRA